MRGTSRRGDRDPPARCPWAEQREADWNTMGTETGAVDVESGRGETLRCLWDGRELSPGRRAERGGAA